VIHSFDLHIVVALKEVGDFALAEFGVAEFASRGGTAEHEFTTLSRTVRGALVGVDQLLNSIQTIELLIFMSQILTWRQCRVLASLELTIIIEL